MSRRTILVLFLLLADFGCSPSTDKNASGLKAAAPKSATLLPAAAPAALAARAYPLRPVRTCRDVAGAPADAVDQLLGRVDGGSIGGAEGLRRLRARRSVAVIIVGGGDFSGADLRGVRLHDVCFVGTKFARSDWRRARAAGVGFVNADLTGAKLQQASMPGVLFDSTVLDRADASGADFSGGRFTGNDFGGWNGLRLDGADLRRFRFDCEEVAGSSCVDSSGDRIPVSFRRADLRGAHLDGFRGDAHWTGARFGETRVDLAKLAELDRIRMSGSLIVKERDVRIRVSPSEYARLRGHIRLQWELPPLAPHQRKWRGAAPWMRSGAEALFVRSAFQVDPALRSTSLYRRLLPAIVAGATSYVRAEVRRSGSLSASGEAQGWNGHQCDLRASHLRPRRDGWYAGVPTLLDGAVPGHREPVPLLRFRANRAEVYEGGHPVSRDPVFEGVGGYVMCAAHARFDEMVRVPYPPRAAKRLWEHSEEHSSD